MTPVCSPPQGPPSDSMHTHLRNSWVRSGPAHTSRRLSHGSPLGSGTLRCPGTCLGTAHGPSTLHLDLPGTAHIGCQRNLGSSRAPVRGRGRGRREAQHRPGWMSPARKRWLHLRATEHRPREGRPDPQGMWRMPSTALPWWGWARTGRAATAWTARDRQGSVLTAAGFG